ncbi:MAG TPA: MFS transporter [Micromonosporaceae bacterium]
MSLTAAAGTRFTRPAMVGMCVSFVVIGVVQAAYGPAIPAMRERYDISSAEVGLVVTLHFSGALLGVLGTGLVRARLRNRAFLALALGTMSAGCLGLAVAPRWWLALCAALTAGVGFGWIDVGVNELFLEFYGHAGTGMLNLLHGNFGVGAVLGPVLVGLLPGPLYRWAFVVSAALCLAVLFTTGGLSGRGMTGPPSHRARFAAAWRLTVLFMVFFGLHVGVETGVAGWETSHLVHLGWAAAPAAIATSGFWLAMTVVRFAVTPVARWFTAQQILIVSILVMLAGTGLAHWQPAAALGYVIAGVGVGPLFPTGLVWLAQKLPGVPATTSYVVAAAMLGGVVPGLIGAAVARWGMGVIPTGLTIIGAATLASALVIRACRPLAEPASGEPPRKPGIWPLIDV